MEAHLWFKVVKEPDNKDPTLLNPSQARDTSRKQQDLEEMTVEDKHFGGKKIMLKIPSQTFLCSSIAICFQSSEE